MVIREQLTSDELHQLFRYDHETGKIYWRPRPRIWFSNQRLFALWSSKYAGKEAFNHINCGGYLVSGVFGKDYLAHRVVYCMEHGYWPERIDHEDGNKQNNRLSNLVASDPVHNATNAFKSKANTSGVTGVCWDKNRNKWMAKIGKRGECKFLGYFDRFEDAADARLKAEKAFGFSPRHGENRI